MTRDMDMDHDLNPRPHKRQRITLSGPSSASSSSRDSYLPSPARPQTHVMAGADEAIKADPLPFPSSQETSSFAPIPPPELLLALPSLVLHPPTHRNHLRSIYLSQTALRRCLQLDLDQDIQCRVWTALAELGLAYLSSSIHPVPGEVENEVERALTKALPTAQKHPSLRLYYSHLMILSAQLSHIQKNHRFAHNTLKRLYTTFLSSGMTRPSSNLTISSDPPHVLYSVYLARIHSHTLDASESLSVSTPASSSPSKAVRATTSNSALQKTLAAVQDLHSLASSFISTTLSEGPSSPLPSTSPARGGHVLMGMIARYIALYTLIRHGDWAHVGAALDIAEADGRLWETLGDMTPSEPEISPAETTAAGKGGNDEARTQIEIGILVLGVVYHTYAGNSAKASERLAKLHSTLDRIGLGGGENFGDGVMKIHFGPNQQALYIAQTHPTTLYTLAFLLSAVAKRDAVGRKPKKGVFAREGLAVLERGGWGAIVEDEPDAASTEAGDSPGGSARSPCVFRGNKEIRLPVYASLANVEGVNRKMAMIKADLMGEVIGLNIMRSEFEEAENIFNALIAHTRTYGLFDAYAARITLQQAQFAHALGNTDRAIQCYRIAEWLAGEGSTESSDEWVRVTARAGQVWTRIGVLRRRMGLDRAQGEIQTTHPLAQRDSNGRHVPEEPEEDQTELEELRKLGEAVAHECEGMGGNLMAIGEVIRACLVKEYLGAKNHLRRALDLATTGQDNHLRALILALVASHYLHTARDHASTMLVTCEQLAAGLGAAAKPDMSEIEGRKAGRDAIGNAQLRLWVGERFLELYRWTGEMKKAEGQERVNGRLKGAVEESRGRYKDWW